MFWIRLIGLVFAIYVSAWDLAFATTYSVINNPFSWVDPTSHTKLGPTLGGVYSTQYKFTAATGCGTAPPTIDDTISDLIPIGFTFTYGGQAFTSVRVMTNGRLQFNNATCGSGSPVTQLPYPNASLTYSMRIYGNDLDPTLKSEVSGYNTTCTSRTACFISYASLGASPDRTFVVTWNQVPEWASGSTATGKYTMQIILKENGEFIYQFKERTAGPNAATGQIGWQVSTTDYAVAGTGFPSTELSYLFYIPNTGSMAPGAFNAFDTSTWVGSTTGVLTTKIAGTAFGFDVVALTSTSPATVQPTFTGAVKVELVNADSSATCTSMTNIQTVAASYSFVGADKGRHSFTGISQANAYRNVKVRISYPATAPTKIACSTDAFAIRPNSFSVSASDSTWTAAGTTRNLNASNATATPTHKAGQPFTLSVSAINSSGAVTTLYSGSPSAAVSCVVPSTCSLGTLSPGSLTFSNGAGVSSSASYSEVGVVSVIVSDTDFAQVDAADGSTLAQRTIASSALTLGRFVPDHFDISLNTPQFAPGCSSFTYVGQPIKYSVRPVATLSAKNASNALVQNYSGTLWKISPSDATYGITPSYSSYGQTLTVLNSSAPAVVDNSGGSGTISFADTFSDVLSVLRTDPIAPFDAEIALSFSIRDTDGVAVANVNGTAASNPISFGAASTGNGIAFTSGNKMMRWGRLAISNANGSELTDLPVPMTAEYFNGTNFVTNSVDQCSVTSLFLIDPVTGSAPPPVDTCIWDNSSMSGSNKCATTGPSAESYREGATLVSGSFNLYLKAPGQPGSLGVMTSVADWLKYNWQGTGQTDPTATATFGIFKGKDQLIYFREVY